jgi:hypothetical protein
MRAAQLAVAALLALPAIATTGPSPALSAPATGGYRATTVGPDGWDPFPRRLPRAVAVRRTGGFAGLRQTVAIAVDGRWRYSDSRLPGTDATGQLNRWQMRRLSAVLSDPDLDAGLVWQPRPIGCGDAFRYSVAVGWLFFRAGYTDCRNPGGPMVALVDAVIAFTPL